MSAYHRWVAEQRALMMVGRGNMHAIVRGITSAAADDPGGPVVGHRPDGTEFHPLWTRCSAGVIALENDRRWRAGRGASGPGRIRA